MLPDRLSATFQTASSALALQRERIAVASRNIANARTSSPKGSKNVYRPQEVITIAPDTQKFFDVLEGSVEGLKRTNLQHISSVDGLVGQKKGNLAPDYQVIEREQWRYEYDPNHPDADKNGMVRYPDIDMVKEMAEMVSANRLYEANLSTIEAEKELLKKSLEI
jgi:flagellar basal-body rod protein FlgC